ncbi:MAG TPA: SPOR domain-containing protein [Gemmatimonadales bacterium]
MTVARRHVGRAVGLALALTALSPYRVTAQNDPRLVAAIQLAQAGRQDSARAIVARLLGSLPAADSVYPEALYTAAILAMDTRSITTSLQRVVVEFSQSPWADDALLRLTQLYFAQGDHASTVQSAERLRRDYPDSPLRGRAGFWGGRSYFQLGDELRGCTLLREAVAGSGDDVEFRNQAEFYEGRCAAVATTPTPPADTTRRVAATGFAVQVLAVRSAQQVDEMLTRLKVMGFQARVVRDTSGFFKVRVGPYPTRDEADRARARLRTRLGGQPFIVEEP